MEKEMDDDTHIISGYSVNREGQRVCNDLIILGNMVDNDGGSRSHLRAHAHGKCPYRWLHDFCSTEQYHSFGNDEVRDSIHVEISSHMEYYVFSHLQPQTQKP